MEIIQIGMRTLPGFLVLLILTRIMGRKQISEITLFHYVTGISIGTIAGSMTVDVRVPAISGVYALVFWTVLTIITGAITRHSIPARKLIDSEPVMVIRDGQILEDALRHRKYNINILLMQLREHEIFDPADVAIGIIETDGKLSVEKVDKQTIPPATTISPVYQNKELIIDGVIQYENLSAAGLTAEWLLKELRKQKISDPNEITVAMITPAGTLYIDKKNDN